MSTQPLTIAHSPCPNDTFIFHAWSHGLLPQAPALQVTFADIHLTSKWVSERSFDLLKISSAALPLEKRQKIGSFLASKDAYGALRMSMLCFNALLHVDSSRQPNWLS